jgi:nucleotide-binding universal stress UspA family protein
MPVLVLRPGGTFPAGPRPDDALPLRVLVPLDGSTCAKAALEPAAQFISSLAAPTVGAMHIVRVVRPASSDLDRHQPWHETDEALLHKAQAYLQATTDHLRRGLVAPAVAELKLAITWSVASDTDVAAALLRVAENGEDARGSGVFGGCDVIAMATHGRSGLQRWTMGSVTERVLRATSLPMLIVRPPETPRASKQAGYEASAV